MIMIVILTVIMTTDYSEISIVYVHVGLPDHLELDRYRMKSQMQEYEVTAKSKGVLYVHQQQQEQ